MKKFQPSTLFIAVFLCITLMSANQALSFFNMFNSQDTYARTKYPIVLVPGVTGFDTLLGVIDYWYGIVDKLEERGAMVYQVSLTPWNAVYEGEVLPGHDGNALRGDDLEQKLLYYIEELEMTGVCGGNTGIPCKLNIISHSHGTTTSRYFMNRHPDKVASLTTIAGPHKGTPTADFAWNNMNEGTQSLVAGGIDFFLGDLIAFLSGNWEYIGENDTLLTVNHFRSDGIRQFNQDFPTEALPYSLDVFGNKEYNDGDMGKDSSKWYGLNCAYNGAPGELKTYHDPQTGTARQGFIHYFSWSGNVPLPMTNVFDVVDLFLVATDVMNKGYGYWGASDGFIPFSSARFGEFLNPQGYYWNHLDEINQTLGLRFPFTPDPRNVIVHHANRLKNMGL